MPKRSPGLYPNYRQLAVVLIVALGVYALLPQFGSFRASWSLIQHPDWPWVGTALLLTGLTYIAAAGTYRFLAFKRLRLGLTVAVQLAGMFVNRLLPAGIGALGVNYLYLRRKRHTTAQAVTVVGANNIVGFFGHGVLLVFAFVWAGESLDRPVEHISDRTLVLEFLAVGVVVAIVAGILYGRQKTARTLHDIRKQLFSYRHRPLSLAGALSTSVCLTGCNVLSLAACLHALSVSLPLSVVLVVFTFGVGAAAAVPTPGGLGGFEAGLAAGFVAYGISPAEALAAAILYRLVSYWTPMVAGIISFVLCERRGVFGATSLSGRTG
jgi:undecaprenyl-diphosphatase